MKPVSRNDHSRRRGARGTSTVVVICASEAMRVAVEISLSLAGYRVVTAGNPEEGLCAMPEELIEDGAAEHLCVPWNEERLRMRKLRLLD